MRVMVMVKADRASMSAGLELRSPLLDHDLTAWLLRSPVSSRFDQQRSLTKLLSRRSLASRVSPTLFDRPKQGFSPPIQKWLAGPLAGQVADALERLEGGRLAPIVLPPGCSNWSDCESALGDGKIDFLWRIISFSEWSKQACDS